MNQGDPFVRPVPDPGGVDGAVAAADWDVRAARILLAHLVEPGSRELGAVIRRFGPVETLDRLITGQVPPGLAACAKSRIEAGTASIGTADQERFAVRQYELAARLGARVLIPEDPGWPAGLADLARVTRPSATRSDRDCDPPICLWVAGCGRPDLLLARSVAVVGARAATAYGQHIAGELAYGLAERQWAVVSGGAFGIDAAAHRGALAAGGSTVAVMACGIDRRYPAAHTALYEQILDTGCLLSEWPLGSDPYRTRFLTRNRVIAAITRGTVVVEAGSRSGARNTLATARRLGRATMAVPGPVTSAMSVGCHAELRQIGTRLVTTAEEIVEEVGSIGELAPVPQGLVLPVDELSLGEAKLLDAVFPRRWRTCEELAAAAGVSATFARRTMPQLVAAGFVTASVCGYRLSGDYRLTTGRAPDRAAGSGAKPEAKTKPEAEAETRAGTKTRPETRGCGHPGAEA